MRNSPICVDASVVVRLVVPSGDSLARDRWEQWSADSRTLIAPTLLYYEVANALYQYRRSRQLSAEAVGAALQAAQSLSVELLAEPDLHELSLKIADQFELSATYDAHYLALSASLRAEFWTADRRLCRRVQQDLPWVHLLE